MLELFSSLLMNQQLEKLITFQQTNVTAFGSHGRVVVQGCFQEIRRSGSFQFAVVNHHCVMCLKDINEVSLGN